MSKITAEDLAPKYWPRLAYKIFSSYFLAMWVLIFMTLVTLLGTLYQVDHGLFAAKQKYFHSFFIYHRLGDGLPVPEWLAGLHLWLPGGLLLMLLLTINLVIGALIKVKKRSKGIGMLIAHFGIIFLLISGWVTYAFNREGYMALYEGQASNRVESYRQYQVEIIPLDEAGKGEKVFVIPPEKFETMESGGERTFTSASLPFSIELSGFVRNAFPIPVSAPVAKDASGPEINGYRLLVQKAAKEAEQNLPAVVARFVPTGGESEPVETFLSARSANFDPGGTPMAFGFQVGDQKFAARMVKENWEVPFKVRLDKFIFERHPGVSMARSYESRITRVEGGTEKAVDIKMNEPMRHGGYTFFQESFGPQNAGPGERMYSQFAVHNNPADQWPLYALLVTGAGLLIHFGLKLEGHLSRSRPQAKSGAAENREDVGSDSEPPPIPAAK
ncbi:MAG: cytochrome c biogenesis protein ResB [Verrucomicrobiae bacterium]|nr:cytochrome c biogenesis protein ResB [Verrucomicrobiae bacterium]